MHEVALVADLVEVASARSGGAPVGVVRVRYATTIPEDVLRQAFEMLAADGPLAGAALDAEPFDIRLDCPCGFSGALGHDDMVGTSIAVCPSCGDVSTPPRTAEIELLEVRAA
ncbi:MAG TPA: hydrogenase/urease maturation nickel metallochaperone HypA [Candidatus Limnocylindrales bacterium]|nr:hydrogenase/urease maturation nickel metallochaperone HypA [Candidatus Limnocylindrales bacterium]